MAETADPIHYAEYAPRQELSGWVRSYWSLKGPVGLSPQLVVPDGCMELVVNLAAPLEQVGAVPRRHPLVTFVGELRRPVLLAPTGAVELFGVRFVPGGVQPFVDAKAFEAADDVHGDGVLVGPLRSAMETVRNANPQDRLRLLESALLAVVRRSTHDDGLARRGARRILEAGGAVDLAELETQLGASRRQLERVFKQSVGISPKSLAQVVRFRSVLRAIESQRPDWARLATDSGYYDQSHLIRDFLRYTGHPPTAYLKTDHELSELFDGSVATHASIAA